MEHLRAQWTKAAFYNEEIDEGAQTDFDVSPSMARGDWGFYSREEALRISGMPQGQVFTSNEAAERYASMVMRDAGINKPVIVQLLPGERIGVSDSVWARDGSHARIRLTEGMHSEAFLLHELAHLIYREESGKGGASHGSGYSAVYARLMNEYLGVSLRLFASRREARSTSVLYRGVVLDLPVARLIEDMRGGLADLVADSVLENNASYRDGGRGGQGVHWTGNEGIAEDFASGMRGITTNGMGYITAGHKYSEGRGPLVVHCPAVLIGRPDVNGLVSDEKIIHDIGWALTQDEDEYPVSRGTQIHLDAVKVALPTIAQLRDLAERDAKRTIIYENVTSTLNWTTLTVPLRVTAATAMALPDFKRTDRNMSDKQVVSWCAKVIKDMARELGYDGPLPEVMVQDMGGTADARSIDPGEMREFPNGLIMIDPFLVEQAKDRESGYSDFRIIAHEAIHNLLQRQAQSYANSTKIIMEGSAEILSIAYWAANGAGFGGGKNDPDAIHENGYGWVGGDVALASRINYHEFIIEVLRRAASKVGWDQARILAEVKRIAQTDRNSMIEWLKVTDPEYRLPSGMPATAEGMMLWLVRSLPSRKAFGGR